MKVFILYRSPDLSDLLETFPSVGHSLKQIMDHQRDNFTDTFNLDFTVRQLLIFTYMYMYMHA